MGCEGNHNGQDNNCTLSSFERNRYFYGKLMTVRDFKAEQDYFNGKRHMLNRLIHGVGIVCGLEVSKLNVSGNELSIEFSEGVALDCCGREIVVPPSSEKIKVSGMLTDGNPNYLYLKYKECATEKVPAVSNASACEEVCCDNRVKETYSIEVTQVKPDAMPLWEETITKDDLKKGIRCPECKDPNYPKVLLAVLIKDNNGVWGIDDAETRKWRSVVFSNPILYKLINSHLTDFSNPHNVTAGQVGALKSIEGVENPGGNIELVRQDAIIINADNNAKTITIGESHSAKTDNPHNVTALQTGALVSVNGVRNLGGNIDVVAGVNITITPDDTNNLITIASTAAIDPALSVTSVGSNKVVGTINKYAHEDHVHDIGKGIIAFDNLNEILQTQLNNVFMYLRERALKCMVISFREVGIKLESKIAKEIAKYAKEQVDKQSYENENKFMEAVGKLTKQFPEFENEMKDEHIDIKDFGGAVVDLKKKLSKKESVAVAAAMDEVCFYAMLLDK